MAQQTKRVATTTKTDAESAEWLLKLANHRWFGGRFPPDGELAVARLLLGARKATARGDPIHKKAAAAVMGVEDARTARKYVALAEKQGLLKALPARNDRRKELLHPTPLLEDLLQREFEEIAAEVGGAQAATSERGALGSDKIDRTQDEVDQPVSVLRVPKSYELMAMKEQRNGNLALAVRYYNTAIKREPKRGSLYIERAVCLTIMHRSKEAIADFHKGLELGAGGHVSYCAYCYLALEYDNIGNYKRAREMLKNAEIFINQLL